MAETSAVGCRSGSNYNRKLLLLYILIFIYQYIALYDIISSTPAMIVRNDLKEAIYFINDYGSLSLSEC